MKTTKWATAAGEAQEQEIGGAGQGAGERSGSAIRRRPRRSIDAILARREARRRQRRHVFPPDFLHGAAQLDEIYEALATRWVEQAAFVEWIRDHNGRVVGVTLARMSEGFLSVQQALVGEEDDLHGWLSARCQETRTVVELVLQGSEAARGQVAQLGGRCGAITICCGRERLWELERETLKVTRDYAPRDLRSGEEGEERLLEDSRTNLLSLIGLCARLSQQAHETAA